MQTPEECLRLYSPGSRDGSDQKENNSVIWKTLEGGVTVAGALQILLWQAKIYENNGERSKADKIRVHVADFLSDASEPAAPAPERDISDLPVFSRDAAGRPTMVWLGDRCVSAEYAKHHEQSARTSGALSGITHEEFDQIA